MYESLGMHALYPPHTYIQSHMYADGCKHQIRFGGTCEHDMVTWRIHGGGVSAVQPWDLGEPAFGLASQALSEIDETLNLSPILTLNPNPNTEP